MKISKRFRTLIIGVIVISVLAAAVILLTPENGEPNPTPNPVVIKTIIEKDWNNIETLALSQPGFSAAFSKGSEGVWFEEEHDYAVNETNVRTVAMNFSQAAGMVILDDTGNTDLLQYGLGGSGVVITAAYSGGETITLNVGIKTADGEGYYAMRDGDPALYIIPYNAGYKYYYTYEELLSKRLPAISKDTLTYLSIDIKGQESISADKALVPESEIERLSKYGINTLLMTSPVYGKLIYPDDFSTAVITVTDSLRLDKITHMYPEPGDFARCGLDEPEISITLIDEKSSFDISLGNYTDDSKEWRYCSAGGRIFRISSSAVQPLFGIKPLNFIQKMITVINIYDVEHLFIKTADAEYNIDINPRTVKKGDGTEDFTIAPVINGRPVDQQAFRVFYQCLVALSYDAVYKEPGTLTQPAVSVSYNLNTGAQDVTDNFYIFDANYYIIEKNGVLEHLISKIYINEMLTALASLAARD